MDQGKSFGDSTDQRGEPRPQDNPSIANALSGDGSDIGAVEVGVLSVSIGNARATEGDSGDVPATFSIQLLRTSALSVTVDYATEDDTASSPGDYLAASDTITFQPGQTLKDVTVNVAGAALDEFSESFFVNLSSPPSPQGVAVFTDGPGIGTIRDDDATPSLSVNDVTVTEGNSGTTNARFTVSLSAASGQEVSVNYSTLAAQRSLPVITRAPTAPSPSPQARRASRWRSRSMASPPPRPTRSSPSS